MPHAPLSESALQLRGLYRAHGDRMTSERKYTLLWIPRSGAKQRILAQFPNAKGELMIISVAVEEVE